MRENNTVKNDYPSFNRKFTFFIEILDDKFKNETLLHTANQPKLLWFHEDGKFCFILWSS